MGALDTVFSEVASNLISAFVTNTSTLTRAAVTTYTPITGVRAAASPVLYTIKTSPPEAYMISEINNTSILKEDLKVMVATKGLTIVPDLETDTITRSGVVYRIVSVTPLSSGDSVAAYELQLRK